MSDKNSKFFHLSTIICRRSNNIDAIKNEDSSWIQETSQIRAHFKDSFINQFKEGIPSPEEIKAALFQMHDLNAPGLDGFPPLFHKKLWSTVGNYVVKAVTSFFILGSLPKELNCSLIVLIPKISNPTTVNHFMPDRKSVV